MNIKLEIIFIIKLLLLCEIYFVKPEYSRFMVLPQSQNVIEGDSVIFNCLATSEEGLQYSWTYNGQHVYNSTNIQQINSNLHINGVKKDSNSGDYICIATSSSSGARLASPPAHLSIRTIPTATVELIHINESEAILKCHVEGFVADKLKYDWFRNSENIRALQGIELFGNQLIIHKPNIRDNALYRCTASNAASRVYSKKAYILNSTNHKSNNGPFNSRCIPRLKNNKLVAGLMNQIFLCRGKRGGAAGNIAINTTLPTADISIIEAPMDVIVVKENDAAELRCQYKIQNKYLESGTSVQLRWRKDSKIVRQIDLVQNLATTAEPNIELMPREDSRIVLFRENGSIIFTSVIASDAGLYTCEIYAEGYAPVTSTTSDLQVIEQLKFMPQPTSKNLELGSVGKVHCKAQGTPAPKVKWLKDKSLELPDTIDDINGTLIFKSVTNEHRGNYTCFASNSQGQINATVSINVVVAPKFSVPPEGPIETEEKGVVVIHCQAIGDPKPTIQWDKDLKYLSENNTDKSRFSFLENGTLEIRNVQLDDEGYYGCTIGNSAGLKREEVRFIVKPTDGYIADENADGFLITRAVLITMSVAFAYIILVVGLMIWCRYRRKARKARLNESNKDNAESGEADGDKDSENEPECSAIKTNASLKTRKVNGNNNPRGSGNEAQKSDDTVCSNHSKGSKISHAFDQLALPHSALTELIQIGRGEFGDVFVGKIKISIIKDLKDKDTDTEKKNGHNYINEISLNTTNVTFTSTEKRRSKSSMDDIVEIKEESEVGNDSTKTSDNDNKLVLVKALNKVKDENACHEFKRQIEMFRAISHKGVVQLFGVCKDKDPHYMVLEYTDWGDLKQFLLATAGKVNTSTNSSSPPPLKTGQILAVAYQIARGMDAIYRARFIHKDLATRNCVISGEFIVKVSYPGLCKDKYNREYFKHRNTLLPIRWLAPECIQEDEYTTKSDIYAFGVVVWELFNQATKIPFEELSNEQVLQQSQNNKLHWTCAEGTPDTLKEIITSCWNANPKERPSFSQICTALSKAIQNGDK